MKFSSLFDKMQDATTLKKAREYARWSIPSLMAYESKDGKARAVVGDFQSDGAILVNGLASKLAGLLFPSTHPFMRVNLSDEDKAAIEKAGGSNIDGMFAKLEQSASMRVFNNSSFNQLVMVLKNLIVTGNAALYRDSESQRVISFNLDRFAVRRDGIGRVVDAVVKETTYFELLSPETQSRLIEAHSQKYDPDKPYEQPLTTYTRIIREPGVGINGIDMFHVAVQVEDVAMDSEYSGSYSEFTCPWIFPTWNLISGENYGRGLVEDHAGGFAKLSELSEALALYEVESLQLINLVGNAALNAKDELAKAETGAWVAAEPDSVANYESGTFNKIELVQADLDREFSKLARAFMYQGNTRDAERVTAYELRQEALEVEQTMGGAYSVLAETLQLPLSHVLIQEEDPDFIQAMLESTGGTTIGINTGLSALGRATKVQNILRALEEGRAAIELSQIADQRIDPYKIMDIIYQGRSVDPQEIHKSDAQLREEAEAEIQQQQAMAQMQNAEAQANLQAGEETMEQI